jgi:hypothetical protein
MFQSNATIPNRSFDLEIFDSLASKREEGKEKLNGVRPRARIDPIQKFGYRIGQTDFVSKGHHLSSGRL